MDNLEESMDSVSTGWLVRAIFGKEGPAAPDGKVEEGCGRRCPVTGGLATAAE